MGKYVVVVVNNMLEIQVVGSTFRGNPIGTRDQAQRIADKIKVNNPRLDVTVHHVEPSQWLQGVDREYPDE